MNKIDDVDLAETLSRIVDSYNRLSERAVSQQIRTEAAEQAIQAEKVRADALEEDLEDEQKRIDLLDKQWHEMKYAYDYSKENSLWHEERHGQVESDLYECEQSLREALAWGDRMREALDDVANGKVPPGIITTAILQDALAFKSTMWLWSQEKAREALALPRPGGPEFK